MDTSLAGVTDRADMRIVFMGTPDFAVPSLDALVAAGHEVIAAYTQPPRRAGRGKAWSPSPVQLRAEALGIAVWHPASLRNAETQAAFAALDTDIAVVAAYGLILPQPILDAPRQGCINVHASLLPRWRGAAPIHRAILAGDAVTGVTIMAMEAGLDTGPMLAKAETPVDGKNTGQLTGKLAEIGAHLIVEVLSDLPAHPTTPQSDDGVTYAAKIDKAESRLDFAASAEAVEQQVRAFAPVPGAWFEVGDERVRVLEANVIPANAGIYDHEIFGHVDSRVRGIDGVSVVLDDALTIACGSGAIRPVLVQRAGRGVMTPAELLRGFPIPTGTRL